jgi:hypothetical protein
MAERGKKCVQCGQAVRLFSGLVIKGDLYHSQCWNNRGRSVPGAGPTTTGEATRPTARSDTAS